MSHDGSQWQAARADFFVPVIALSQIYRAKFRDIMRREGLYDQIDPLVWRKEFVTDSRAVGDGRSTLQYLARYVFRVAISDHRIVSIHESPDGHGSVTYLYHKSGSRRWRKTTLDAWEFIRGFLQHVLPSRLQKVRHYGFLHPQSQIDIEAVRWMVALHNENIFELLCHQQQVTAPPPSIRCAECGGPMIVIAFVPPGKSLAARDPPGRSIDS